MTDFVGVKEPIRPEYLGDGLHAEFDGFQIRLWTIREHGNTHEVFLEPGTLKAFLHYVNKVVGK
jgi:hypothetical protein